MAKSTYQKIKEENQELEHQFRIYGGAGKNDAIELLQPGRTARGKLSATSATTIKLEKKNIWETAEGHKLELVNKDGEYETAIWTTTPENIKKALRSGLFEAADIPNPLAKMIAQIGEYKRQVYEKFIKEGSYSQNHQQKEFIADSTQDCLASLNSLHASINNYNEGLSPERNFQLLLDKVRNLIKEIESMENKAAGEGEPYKTFREGLKELKTDTAEYENKLLLFRVEKGKICREDLVDNILRPYGVSLLGENISIQCFLQKQINQINSFSVGANNMITGAWPTLMGRDALGQSLLEARFTGEKFSNTEIDYHNPLTAAHALDFSGMENEKGLITLDTEKFGFKPKSKLDLLKGLDQLQAIDTQENILLRSKEKIKVGLENWGPFRIGLNGLKDIGGFLCDLGYGLGYAGYAGIQKLRGKPIKKSKFPSSDWEEFHKKEAGEEKIFQSAHSKDLLKKINENTALTEPSFIEKMYGKIYGLGKMLISDPLELVFVETIEMATKAGSDLWQDLAGEPPLSSKKINSILNQCLQLDEAEEKASQAEKESLIQA